MCGLKCTTLAAATLAIVLNACAANAPERSASGLAALPGSWHCDQFGSLVILDEGHYEAGDPPAVGHFLATRDASQLSFLDDGPLAGRAGRWVPDRDELVISADTGQISCRRVGPVPSFDHAAH